MTRYCYRNLNNTSCRNGSAVLQDGLDRRPALAAHAYTVLLPSAGTAAVLAAAVLAAEQAEGAAAVVYALHFYRSLHSLPQRLRFSCSSKLQTQVGGMRGNLWQAGLHCGATAVAQCNRHGGCAVQQVQRLYNATGAARTPGSRNV